MALKESWYIFKILLSTLTTYRISSDKRRASNKRTPLKSIATLNMALIKIVSIF